MGVVGRYLNRIFIVSSTLILAALAASSGFLHNADGAPPYTWNLDQYTIARTSVPYSAIDTAVVVGDPGGYKALLGELKSRGIEVVQVDTLGDVVSIAETRGPILVIAAHARDIDPGTLASLLNKGNPVVVDSKLYTTLLDLAGSSVRPTLPEQGYYAMIKPALDGYHIFLAKDLAGPVTAKSLVEAVLKENYMVRDGCHQLVAVVSATAEWQPYGALQVDNYVYYHSCELMQDRDPYYVKAISEITPGKYLGWSDRGQWWSDRLYTKYDLSQDPNIDLHDFDPRGTVGDPVGFTVTIQIPFAISISWSLTDDNPVQSTTSLGTSYTNIAEWEHELGSGFWSIFPSGTDVPAGVAPGFSFTAAEGSHSVQYWEVTGVWSRPGPRGMPIDTFQGTLLIELHLIS